jgi:hypothetical protein
MKMASSVLLKFLPVMVFVFPLVFLVQVVVFRPYFGNMDDSVLLDLVAITNPLEYAQQYGWRPGYGFIQNVAMLITWPTYALGSAFGPTVFFAVNAIVVFGVILLAAHAFKNALGWTSPATTLTFVSVVFLWPYTSDLFFFPSLQEKGVIFGAAALFYWIGFTRIPRSSFVYWSTFVLVSILAFATKTHIVLLIPAAIAAMWVSKTNQGSKKSYVRLVGASIGWLVVAITSLTLALTGSYSSGTQGSRNLTFLTDRRFQLLLAISTIYAAYLVYRLARGRYCNVEIVPLLIVGPFVASFAFWEVRNYYLSVAAVGVAAMVASVINNWSVEALQFWTAIAVFAISLLWVFWRAPQVYQPLSSLAEFLESPIAERYSQLGSVIGVSCVEAPTHFNKYAQWLDSPGLTFESSADPSQFRLFLADSRLCPAPAGVALWPVKWQGPADGGYLLYEHTN